MADRDGVIMEGVAGRRVGAFDGDCCAGVGDVPLGVVGVMADRAKACVVDAACVVSRGASVIDMAVWGGDADGRRSWLLSKEGVEGVMEAKGRFECGCDDCMWVEKG